ncbi:MAG: hypothetical protein K8E66_01225, partial [Phycisphaerales bacterium]|nr:hypothetical protein [Phycisphaerales bacterium]
VPTLSGVQTAGRKAATQSLLTGLNQAAASFELDTRRQPGYFAMSSVGAETNWDDGGPGLTALENAMLDLAGVGAVSTTEPDDPNNWVVVNPTSPTNDASGSAIWVKTDLMGSDEGNYFLPGAGALVHMTTDQQPGDITAAAAPKPGLPDLVDPFGQPVLAWIEDPSVSTTVSGSHDFVAPANDEHPSRFYWTANGSMLSSESLGERGASMILEPGKGGSLIGKAAFDEGHEQIEGVMAALLGHPGYPDEATLRGGNGYDDVFPKQARGGFIAHSAGPDGVYLAGDDDRAGRVLTADMLSSGTLDVRYGINFFAGPGGPRRTGENGQPVTADFLDGFDDIVVSE